MPKQISQNCTALEHMSAVVGEPVIYFSWDWKDYFPQFFMGMTSWQLPLSEIWAMRAKVQATCRATRILLFEEDRHAYANPYIGYTTEPGLPAAAHALHSRQVLMIPGIMSRVDWHMPHALRLSCMDLALACHHRRWIFLNSLRITAGFSDLSALRDFAMSNLVQSLATVVPAPASA